MDNSPVKEAEKNPHKNGLTKAESEAYSFFINEYDYYDDDEVYNEDEEV